VSSIDIVHPNVFRASARLLDVKKSEQVSASFLLQPQSPRHSRQQSRTLDDGATALLTALLLEVRRQ